jgi:cytochrome c-type biogenesis protein
VKISSRWQTFFHALAFVAGFTLVFVILGASVAFVGYALNAWMPTIAKIGGVVLILFGLQVAGLFPWLAGRIRATGGDKNPLGHGFVVFTEGLSRAMYTEGRVQVRADRRWGYLASFMMGIFFSAGWIPCVGPVLSAILLLAGDTQTVAQGALLLLVYSIGLGIPFLITGAALATVTPWLRKMNRYLGIVSRITGIFLIFIGVLLLTDQLTLITTKFVGIFGMGLASFDAGASAAVTLPIAFIAGLLSFLSPCVLPLIPAYIGYLSGTAVADGAAATTS